MINYLIYGQHINELPCQIICCPSYSLEEKNMRIYFGEVLTIITVFYFIAVILI